MSINFLISHPCLRSFSLRSTLLRLVTLITVPSICLKSSIKLCKVLRGSSAWQKSGTCFHTCYTTLKLTLCSDSRMKQTDLLGIAQAQPHLWPSSTVGSLTTKATVTLLERVFLDKNSGYRTTAPMPLDTTAFKVSLKSILYLFFSLHLKHEN